MFKSWDDIDQKFEVFLFMCGIIEDPSPVIDHMCEQYPPEIFTDPECAFEEDYLFKITQEVRSKKQFLNPLCNEQFYHVWQLPLRQQSRLYFFGRNLDLLNIGDNANTSHKTYKRDLKENDCGVLIRGTCLPPCDVLQAISTLRQTITFLSIEEPFVLRDEVCDNIPARIFKIDPSASKINIGRNVVLPKAVSKDLGWQLSICYNLSELHLQNQPLVAAEITDFLGINRNLRILNVEDCYLSENKVYKICEQLSQLSNLDYCGLSGNDLGDAVSVLAESIKSWGTNTSLRWFILNDCDITSGGCSRLLEALEVCPNLFTIDLSDNTIGGAFDGLISKPLYPGLSQLQLDGTSLTPGDIQAIDSLIKENKMPQLRWLSLSDDILDNLELNTLETLESLSSIIHNVRYVRWFKENYLPQDLEKIQERITTGILKHKSKNITNI